jgi:hypothetical protein
MTGNVALDVVIGLVFVFTLYSLLTTTIVELISTYFQFRARNLSKAIKRMLDDDNEKEVFSRLFFKQPIIKFMASGYLKIFNKPSYLQARNFSQALIQVLKEGTEKDIDPVLRIRTTLKAYENTDTGRFLLSLLDDADNKIENFKALVEQWFDDTMERVTGWYIRRITIVTFIVGFIIATIFNADTFQIAGHLSKDQKAREQYVQLAGNMISNNTIVNSAFDTALRGRLLQDSLLIRKFKNDPVALKKFVSDSVYNKATEAQQVLLTRIDTLYAISEKSQNILSFKRIKGKGFIYDDLLNFAGCLITTLALSLGAPFWFDILSKLVQLRSAVSKTVLANDKQKTNSLEPSTRNKV